MSQITVLLVDDDKHIRSILSSTLMAANLRVIEAVDGLHALELATEYAGEIDVVVTDIRMPGMHGIELRGKLNNMYPHIRFIVVSSYADAIFQAYPDWIVFSKPVSPDTLVEKIHELMGVKHYRSASS